MRVVNKWAIVNARYHGLNLCRVLFSLCGVHVSRKNRDAGFDDRQEQTAARSHNSGRLRSRNPGQLRGRSSGLVALSNSRNGSVQAVGCGGSSISRCADLAWRRHRREIPGMGLRHRLSRIEVRGVVGEAGGLARKRASLRNCKPDAWFVGVFETRTRFRRR
jgi:hypothetical protein